jgi:two-component system response regulator AtoC
VFRDAALIAPSDSSVLITGESGVGKEIVADLIHAWSARASGPLVKVNCAAIPDNLLESELFGHERGSFTGAHQLRIGCFEQADNGTIFLDEIGEMSPPLQAKLLRITQEGRFRRVGGNKEIKTNTRILAATNRNLEAQVKAGQFREDLFYRLNVVEMNFPPLRERHEDIQPLAVLFVSQFAKGKVRLSSAVAECLARYPWPGNVRELRNAIERAVLLCGGEIVLPDHLPARVRMAGVDAAGAAPSAPRSLQEIELQAIAAMLEKHDYNRTETAKALGISRRALTYKLQQLKEAGYRIDPPSQD